jgi:hypothetical protein
MNEGAALVMALGAENTGLSWVRGTEEPIQGRATANVRRWEERALANPGDFAADIRKLGLPDKEVESALDLATSAKTEVEGVRFGLGFHSEEPSPEEKAETLRIYNSTRISAIDRLANWWRRRAIRVDDRTMVKLDLPLFVFSAASVPGCVTSFTMQRDKAQDLGWSVAIFGTGLSADATVSVSASATFRAAAGQAKLVFLPVTVAVERVTVLDHGKPISQAHRIDVSSLGQQVSDPGLLLLSADARPALGMRARRYELAGDQTGGISSFEYLYRTSVKLAPAASINVYGLNLGLHYETRLEQDVMLAYDLSGGYDYELRETIYGDGVLWSTPGRSDAGMAPKR